MHRTRRAQRRSLFALITLYIATGMFASSVRIQALSSQSGGGGRTGHTITTLVDGRLLIAGGDENGTCEIYDPSTGQTTLLEARLNVARAYHGAVLLADGNVLIVGGYAAGGGSIERSAETVSVAAGLVEKVTGGTQSARVHPSLTVRADGVVQILGGDESGSTEFYDPATRTFGPDPAAASVTTDRLDYAPGETVTFLGRRWAAGEAVRIELQEEPNQHDDRELLATADESGAFINTDFAPEAHDLGVTFHVTATGLTSGRQAAWIFTDGAPASTGYTTSSFTGGTFVAGTSIVNSCDDCLTTIALPFPVTIYDQTFTSATLSSNGAVLFTRPFSTAYQNSNLPSDAFDTAILPYWDDLRTDGDGHGIFIETTGAAPNRVFHIRYSAVYYSSPSDVVNFELLLYESLAEFDVVYGSFRGSGSATIGVQRRSAGLSTSYGESPLIKSLPSGTVLRFAGTPVRATTTALSSSANPSVFGQSTILTATVTADGTPVVSGTVTFAEGTTTLAEPIALDGSGRASFSTSLLSPGRHAMTASYNCPSTWGSSSAGLTQTVDRSKTSTGFSSSVRASVFGQPVTFTANVRPVSPGSGMPSGTVQFQANGVNIADPVTIAAGGASLTVSSLSSGSHAMTAVYSGDESFVASSGSLSYTISAADTTTTVGATVNPSVYGQETSFDATVAAVSPGSGTPAGFAQFRDNGADLGPAVPLRGGRASLALSSLPAGAHTITAAYQGDDSFNRSTSAAILQTVNKAPATIVLTGLAQTFDGYPRAATVSTRPADLSGVSISYNGSPTLPIAPGTYTVVASLNSANYSADEVTASLVIDRASQTISFNPLGDRTYGDEPVTVSASATSGLPVIFSAAGACTVSGTVVTLVSGGLCTVTAEQPGDANHYAAPGVSRQFDIAYTWSNVLPPLRVDGTSVFKLGSTIPVKFQLTGAASALANLAARIYVKPAGTSSIGTEIEGTSSSAADPGNTFRYDSASGQYVFNLGTKLLTQGTWQIRIDLQDASPVTHAVVISLK